MLIPRRKPVSAKRLKQLQRNEAGEEYTNWRKAVLKRDSFQCQWPGCEEKTKLEIHHIKKFADAPHLKTARENGITLCHKHHKGIQNKEGSYELYFMKIVQKLEDDNQD